MKRRDVLKSAADIVCKDRENTYGKPEDNFERIAALWNAYFGIDELFDGETVGIMLAMLKIARIRTGKYKEDNYIDLAGYAACAGELAARKAFVNEAIHTLTAAESAEPQTPLQNMPPFSFELPAEQ